MDGINVKPACEGMSRKEITSLLNSELIRLRLERRNAYAYWAHEVELHDYTKDTLVRADFVQFEPAWYHSATHAGCVEQGTFTFYEVKSCLEDMKSGNGLNFFGDKNYIVMPVEVYPKFIIAWNGTRENRYEDIDRKLRAAFPHKSYFNVGFLLYGKCRNGRNTFHEVEAGDTKSCRVKPAAELLFCLMRAMIADSDRSDVSHDVVRNGFERGD